MDYCPAGDFTCPYFGESGVCTIGNPKEECEEYAYYEEE